MLALIKHSHFSVHSHFAIFSSCVKPSPRYPLVRRINPPCVLFPPHISSVCMMGVSRAHPRGHGALTDDSLAPAAPRTSSRPRCRGAAVEGPTGPRRRQRRTRRTCGWTSASPSPQASPRTWTTGMTPSSPVGAIMGPKNMIVVDVNQIQKHFICQI